MEAQGSRVRFEIGGRAIYSTFLPLYVSGDIVDLIIEKQRISVKLLRHQSEKPGCIQITAQIAVKKNTGWSIGGQTVNRNNRLLLTLLETEDAEALLLERFQVAN